MSKLFLAACGVYFELEDVIKCWKWSFVLKLYILVSVSSLFRFFCYEDNVYMYCFLAQAIDASL